MPVVVESPESVKAIHQLRDMFPPATCGAYKLASRIVAPVPNDSMTPLYLKASNNGKRPYYSVLSTIRRYDGVVLKKQAAEKVQQAEEAAKEEAKLSADGGTVIPPVVAPPATPKGGVPDPIQVADDEPIAPDAQSTVPGGTVVSPPPVKQPGKQFTKPLPRPEAATA